MQKEAILLLCGGKSAEHEISLLTATNILKEIDKDKYCVHLVCISKEGKWLYFDSTVFKFNSLDPKTIKIPEEKGREITLIPGRCELFFLDNGETLKVDVAFPVVHGTKGEDGCLQGYLEICGIPFVGAGVLGSALGMDKVVMKKLLRDAKILSADFLSYNVDELNKIDPHFIIEKLSLPLYVKPANMGSSIGISRVEEQTHLMQAIEHAFEFDSKILIEKEISGRELEVAVLGNHELEASLPGEILTQKDNFYSYEEKYLKDCEVNTLCPAKLRDDLLVRIQDLSKKVFKLLDCKGLARVDFFLSDEGSLFVNEINTLPGFTKISMYPKLFLLSGISYSQLIRKLISLAKENKKECLEKI